jgi:iron complex outermembrane recepter protein
MGWLARTLCSLALASAVLPSTSISASAEEPSTIYVLTRPEIASLGVRTLPDVLRTMPGIRVTGSGEKDWTVTTTRRGDSLEGRLLVLIDGRQIEGAAARAPAYAPAPLLSEIDRIELIRGRAAALYGKSASNGVIHIITTRARYTQGVLRPHRGG